MERSNSSEGAATREIEEEVGRLAEQARELQESAASLFSKSSVEEQSLRQHALSLDSSILHCHSLICSDKLLHPKFACKLQEDLQRARCLIVDEDTSAFLSSKAQGRFLRMFLGPINARATRKDIQLKFKEEYNSYRDLNLDYAKVVQALNLDYADFHPCYTNRFASEYDVVLNARTEGLLAQQRRGLRAKAVLRLPQEWTY